MRFIWITATLIGCGSVTGGDTMTCDALVSKTITTMEDAQGSDAMLKKEDIPKLTGGCEKANSLEAHARAAECAMGAGDFDALAECDGLNTMVKKWMENA